MIEIRIVLIQQEMLSHWLPKWCTLANRTHYGSCSEILKKVNETTSDKARTSDDES